VWQTIFPEIRNFRPCNFNRLADYSGFPDFYSGKPDSSCGVWIISARDWESGPVNGKKGDRIIFEYEKRRGTVNQARSRGLVFNPGSGQSHGTWWNDTALFPEVVALFLHWFGGGVARKLYI